MHLRITSHLWREANRRLDLSYFIITFIYHRSAQWVVPQGSFDAEMVYTSDSAIGNCILNEENRFTEPESYRVSNYYTIYIENQCRHDCKFSVLYLCFLYHVANKLTAHLLYHHLWDGNWQLFPKKIYIDVFLTIMRHTMNLNFLIELNIDLVKIYHDHDKYSEK